ncbi:hypothetical protein ACFPM0_02625 [Pseudonocardia sulfidoxydans]|uniref:hypothetical protein n=1 Tax=Pseudonocardia sulfidoxydans TaxID=54011 RepID=UPI00360C2A0C
MAPTPRSSPDKAAGSTGFATDRYHVMFTDSQAPMLAADLRSVAPALRPFGARGLAGLRRDRPQPRAAGVLAGRCTPGSDRTLRVRLINVAARPAWSAGRLVLHLRRGRHGRQATPRRAVASSTARYLGRDGRTIRPRGARPEIRAGTAGRTG